MYLEFALRAMNLLFVDIDGNWLEYWNSWSGSKEYPKRNPWKLYWNSNVSAMPKSRFNHVDRNCLTRKKQNVANPNSFRMHWTNRNWNELDTETDSYCFCVVFFRKFCIITNNGCIRQAIHFVIFAALELIEINAICFFVSLFTQRMN